MSSGIANCPRCNAPFAAWDWIDGKFVEVAKACEKCRFGTPMGTLLEEMIELKKENAELRDAMGYAESFIAQAKEADTEVEKLRAELLAVDERWKEAFRKRSQPTLCDGSDQLKGKTPEEVAAIIHSHIRFIYERNYTVVDKNRKSDGAPQSAVKNESACT